LSLCGLTHARSYLTHLLLPCCLPALGSAVIRHVDSPPRPILAAVIESPLLFTIISSCHGADPTWPRTQNFKIGFKKILAELVKAKAAAAGSGAKGENEKGVAFTRQQCAELLRQQLEEVSYLFDADASPL
jgi:hypothetical protein